MTETDTPVQEAPLTKEGEQVATLLAMAEKNPAVAKLPEVQQLQAKVKEFQEKKAAPAATTPAATPVAQPAAAPAQNANTTPAATPAAAPAQPAPAATQTEEEKQEQRRSIFNANKRTEVPSFKDIDEYSAHIEKTFGVKDPAKFVQSAEKWRTDSQNLSVVSAKAEGLEDLIANAPEALYEGLNAYVRGEDWRSVVKNNIPDFDYSKSFEKQAQDVVNHYFPGKFQPEELKDITNTVAQNAIEVAKEKFNLTKNSIEKKRATMLEEADRKAKVVKASAEGSVEKLDEAFPEFDSRRKSEIKQILLSGDINSIFFNQDGTYKPDAAKRLALALHGEEEITGKVVKAKTKAASEASTAAIMDTVNRGSSVPPPTTSQVGQQETVPEHLQNLMKSVNKKNFY